MPEEVVVVVALVRSYHLCGLLSARPKWNLPLMIMMMMMNTKRKKARYILQEHYAIYLYVLKSLQRQWYQVKILQFNFEFQSTKSYASI